MSESPDRVQALRPALAELHGKEAELRVSEEQLRDFVENANIGLHRVGRDGKVLWANRAELELLGYRAEEYIGQHIASFHADASAIDDILARLSRGEHLADYPARLRAKDGSIRHVLISSSVCWRDGEFLYTRCFTRDITERRVAEEKHRQGELLLGSITDSIPGLVCFITPERRYGFVNAAYERWFGRPKAAFVGHPLEEVVGPAAYAVIRPELDRALQGELRTFEAEIPYPDLGTRYVESSLVPQYDEQGRVTGCVCLIQDCTERRALQRFHAEAAPRAARLGKITAAIADAVTKEEVFEAVVDQLAAALGASSAVLWLLDPGARRLQLARSVGYSAENQRRFAQVDLDLAASIPALDAFHQGRLLTIPSKAVLLEKYPHLAGAATATLRYSVCCLPLVSQGRALGVLGLTSSEEQETSDEDRIFLSLIGRYASQALERLRLLEAERRSREAADAAAARLALLSRASRIFVEAQLDLDLRLRDIARELGTLLGGSVVIALLEEGGLRFGTVYHPIPEAQEIITSLANGRPVKLGEGFAGTVAATGRSAMIASLAPADIAVSAAPRFHGYLERYPAHALLCVPLRARGRVIGTVTATRATPGAYTSADLQLLEELAERAAAAIDNSRMHQEIVAGRARAEQLYRFAQAVVAADRLEDVFHAALDAIEGALSTRRVAILLHDAAGVMRFRAHRGLSDAYRQAVEGHAPWPRDAVAPQPILVGDVETDASMTAFLPLFRDEGIGSLGFFPLVTGERLIGKFMVYFPEPHAYTAGEIELASAIAHHLASVTARFGAVARLEETLRYNELFAGVLAHDLRNPLSAMMTAAQLVLMRQEGQGDPNARPLSRILASGQRMGRMIEQLLDLTRARSGGGIELQQGEANLDDVCRQAVEELELAYPEWTVRRVMLGDLNGSWDTDRLVQVVSNLVANAGQHGKRGGEILVEVDGREPGSVTIRVGNEGAIPAAFLPALFDPFRGTHERRAPSRGLGLGLYIVKEIARSHGGVVEVSSSEQGGTSFTVRLPRR